MSLSAPLAVILQSCVTDMLSVRLPCLCSCTERMHRHPTASLTKHWQLPGRSCKLAREMDISSPAAAVPVPFHLMRWVPATAAHIV